MADTSIAVGAGSTPVKWGLRLLVVFYLVMLIAWPSFYVVKTTFDGGLTNLQEALSEPDVLHALKLSECAKVKLVTAQSSARRSRTSKLKPSKNAR